MIGKKTILASFSRSTTQCSWYIESSLDTDKKRRWRAKKKDQHHRTQVSLRHLLNASHQYSSGINENFMFFCVKN
ncbi:unnamed protein product [Rotaria socialis]